MTKTDQFTCIKCDKPCSDDLEVPLDNGMLMPVCSDECADRYFHDWKMDELADVLGAEFWTAQVADETSANNQAAQRLAAGRPAVSYQEQGKWFVAWGVRNA